VNTGAQSAPERSGSVLPYYMSSSEETVHKNDDKPNKELNTKNTAITSLLGDKLNDPPIFAASSNRAKVIKEIIPIAMPRIFANKCKPVYTIDAKIASAATIVPNKT